ncbi:MAG: hypothetical protein ACRDTE_21115 [Pseudonocardiaceae bacterium]
MAKRHKTGSRPDVEIVRLRMQSLGAPIDVIAAEISRRYGYRPRQGYRLAHGWNQTEAAERYNQLVQGRGPEHAGRDTMSPSRVSEYERWPDAARKPSVYALASFAELYGTTIGLLIDAADIEQLSPTERSAVLGSAASARPDAGRPSAVVVMESGADPAALQRRRRRAALVEPDAGRSLAEKYVEVADQSLEAAALAEATNIGDTSVAAIHRRVDEIARLYERSAPLPLFRRTVALRNQVFDLLEGHQHINQTRELAGVAGKLCALLAWMSGDFGQHSAALAQADAAWIFAEQADQHAIRALVRTAQAKTAYWAGEFNASASYAHDGLRYASEGNAVLLASLEARAGARLGDADRAVVALRRADDERDKAGIIGPGGLYGCSEVGRYNFAAGALYVAGNHGGALEAAESAITAAKSIPDDERPYNSIAFAHINAATASIATGDLERAVARIGTVLALPAEQRLTTFGQRLERAQQLLTAPAWRGSKLARELHAQVTDFRLDTVTRALTT